MQPVIPPHPAATVPAHEERHKALIALHDRNIDMATGFATMVEKAEPEFRSTAEHFRVMHARHADTMARLLSDLRVDVGADGTLMGTVHKAVITLRAFFDDIDDDVMTQIRRGEESLVEAYDAAIGENSAHGFAATLRQMQAEVRETLTATQHIG